MKQARMIRTLDELRGLLDGIAEIDGDRIRALVPFSYRAGRGTGQCQAGDIIDDGMTIRNGALVRVRAQSRLGKLLSSQGRIAVAAPAPRAAHRASAAAGTAAGLPTLAELSSTAWWLRNYGSALSEASYGRLKDTILALSGKLQERWQADRVRQRLADLTRLSDQDLLDLSARIEALRQS